ncbi:hypothetical protein NL676_037684 [Syzygium grande]|nr:hypothetical protein NL676_037684 [Syzygium grande]
MRIVVRAACCLTLSPLRRASSSFFRSTATLKRGDLQPAVAISSGQDSATVLPGIGEIRSVTEDLSSDALFLFSPRNGTAVSGLFSSAPGSASPRRPI